MVFKEKNRVNINTPNLAERNVWRRYVKLLLLSNLLIEVTVCNEDVLSNWFFLKVSLFKWQSCNRSCFKRCSSVCSLAFFHR